MRRSRQHPRPVRRSAPRGVRPPRVGLVLGAGGVVGQAYHAGVLLALDHDLGWDPRQAQVIVGTSAGSLAGAALRLGVSAADLACWASEADPAEEGRGFVESLTRAREHLPPLSLRSLVRPWRLPSPHHLVKLGRRPWSFPSAALAASMPRGTVDALELAEPLLELLPAGWPDGLLVCATDERRGERTVFRGDSQATSLPEALAASCAVPGYFAPVRIASSTYLDGAVHSPTNADVLEDHDLDLVIVSSPMSVHGWAPSVDAPIRRAYRRRLRSEVARLRRRGTTVVAFEPPASVIRHMGLDAMAGDRSDRVMREAFFMAGERAARRNLRSLLRTSPTG